jgi:replicative DNA helicase
LLAVQRTRTARRRDDPIPQLDDADAPTLETDSGRCAWRLPRAIVADDEQAEPKAGGEAWDEWEGKVRRAKDVAKIIALKVRSGQPFETREFKWDGRRTMFLDL